MKKLLAILSLTLMSSVAFSAVSPASIKFCAKQAQEYCADAVDFDYCYEYSITDCIDSFSTYSKSVPACVNYCNTLPEATQRQICLQTCSPL